MKTLLFFSLLIALSAQASNEPQNLNSIFTCENALGSSLVGKSSADVTPSAPTSRDYAATIQSDGYQILKDLPGPNGITEANLFRELRQNFPDLFSTAFNDRLIFGSDGKWYREAGPKVAVGDWNKKCSVKHIDLPRALTDVLEARLKLLKSYLPGSNWSVTGSVTLRLGAFDLQLRNFHVDRGNGIFMAETLNRANSPATYVVGNTGQVFEPLPGEGVFFTPKDTAAGIPAGGTIHSLPPVDGERIFVRYLLLPRPTNDNSSRTSYVDESGRVVLELVTDGK